MDAEDMFAMVMDRLESMAEQLASAKRESDDMRREVMEARREADRAKDAAEEMRNSWSRAETRLTIALRHLDSDGRINYEAAINPPKTDASGEVIPF